MSRLSEMIKELCPDGVEYRAIKDCVKKIERIQWATTDETYRYIDLSSVDRDNRQIGETTEICADDAPSRAQQIVRTDDILLGTTRPMLKRYCQIPLEYDNQICSTGFCVLRADNSRIVSRWLYHTISTTSFFDYVERTQHGSSYPAISDTEVKEFEIPVPPLAIQNEIVKLLDNFTELTAELTAELALRKKQYSFYRDSLLNFSRNDAEIEWRTLGDIGSVCMCKRILKQQTNTESGVPFYKIGTFGQVADSYISKELFLEYKGKYSYPRKGEILISAAGTIGRTVVYDGAPAYFQDSNIVWIANDESLVLNRYLYYFYSLFPWRIADGGTIARLYNDQIRHTEIPIPPLETQAKIVSILDRFDALCHDLTQGLPAEIAARKKQYEYYRDKLLTFPSKGA